MSTKTRIVLDLDSVCCDLITPWFKAYNEASGDSLCIDDVLTWDTHLYASAGKAVYRPLDDPKLYHSLKLLPHCFETLVWAAEYFELVIATSRQASMHEVTVGWVNKHLPMVPKENIIFARRKDLVDGDLLIDDCPAHLTAFRGVPIVFGDYPYNQHLTYLYQAPNWFYVLEFLEYLVPGV